MKDSYIFYKDKLSREYLAVFDKIEMYMLTQNFDDTAKEERLGELLDIFLSADEAGRPVENITGGDLEQFCKTFCSDFGWKNRVLFFLDWLRTVAWFVLVISAIELFSFLIGAENIPETDIWNAAGWLNISGWLIGIAVTCATAAVLNIAIRNIMFRRKSISMKLLRAVSVIWMVISFFVVMFFLDYPGTELFYCPAWIMLVVSAVYLAVYYPTRGRSTRRNKVKFSDLVHEEAQKSFPGIMEKKYEKARRRSLRRGHGELSMETFLDKEERDCDLTDKIKYFYYALPIIITACSCIFGEFDGAVDVIIYAAILLTVEYALMLTMEKISRNGIMERRAWIAAKRDEIRQQNETCGCNDDN